MLRHCNEMFHSIQGTGIPITQPIQRIVYRLLIYGIISYSVAMVTHAASLTPKTAPGSSVNGYNSS